MSETIDTGDSTEEMDPAVPEARNTVAVHADDVSKPATDHQDDAEVEDGAAEGEPETVAAGKSARGQRSISISVRSLVVTAVIVVLAGAVVVLSWLYIGAQRKLDAQAAAAGADAHAEKVALDYAVNAAQMDYKDLQAWKVRLVAGTSQELNSKLSEAAESMEQILGPLEWTSTAEPLVAKVRSSSDGIFVVDCFVKVQTKTVQSPEALQSTAAYSVTVDSNKDWQITDVGGIGSMVGQR